MTTVTVYRSSDASAPSLTGQVGALVGVLDACLVNGYGAKSAAGWSKPFANSGNVGCYQNAGTGYCLSVNDNGPGAGGAKEARIVGFTSLASVSTGSGQFPTAAQSSIGTGQLVVRKSNTADGTVRNWTVVADNTVFYMFIESGDFTAPIGALAWMFGDFFSYSSTDANNCMIVGRTSENTSSASTANSQSANGSYVEVFGGLTVSNSTALSNLLAGHYVAANYTGVGGSIQVGKHSDQTKMGTSSLISFPLVGVLGIWGSTSNVWPNEFSYPNGPDQGLYAAPVFIHHNGLVRGYLKGIWCPLQHLPLNHDDTYSGTGNLSGKSFVVQNMNCPSYGGAFNLSQAHVETSSTWN